ncbi:DUF4041 domain-containing protein [Lactococcus petauri]|uniref:DUF4041 domain-containing protein n=1 Tax=Lactococcus petauri TaxID=1940789 RepID=UPI0002E94E81|nr:DUF4041 domain-containing protein [Lactococcus petauri]
MALLDFLKPKDEKLTQKIATLEKELETKQLQFQELSTKLNLANEIERLEELSRKKLSEINKKTAEIESLKQIISSANEAVDLKKVADEKRKELNQLRKDIALANDEIGLQEFGFFERKYNFVSSVKYKVELSNVRMAEKLMVKNNEAGIIIQPLTMDGSANKGKVMQKQLIKAAIRGFNGEADAILTKISSSNLEQKLSAIERSWEQLNKIYAKNLVQISHKYLELKKDELRLAAEFELKKQEEKDKLREEKEREKEERKLQAELAKQQLKYDKDIAQFSNAITLAENKLKIASESEIDELKKQIEQYKHKIDELNNEKEELNTKFSNAKAGYVYIISNVGSFGEGVVKIGVTRRLTPTDRVDELGSASVPFKFSINALVFNDDAFDLETRLHQHFDKYRVNKFNNRKEYFRVDLEKIKSYLETDSSLNVEWNETPENFEYEQTLLLEKNQ